MGNLNIGQNTFINGRYSEILSFPIIMFVLTSENTGLESSVFSEVCLLYDIYTAMVRVSGIFWCLRNFGLSVDERVLFYFKVGSLLLYTREPSNLVSFLSNNEEVLGSDVLLGVMLDGRILNISGESGFDNLVMIYDRWVTGQVISELFFTIWWVAFGYISVLLVMSYIHIIGVYAYFNSISCWCEKETNT